MEGEKLSRYCPYCDFNVEVKGTITSYEHKLSEGEGEELLLSLHVIASHGYHAFRAIDEL